MLLVSNFFLFSLLGNIMPNLKNSQEPEPLEKKISGMGAGAAKTN